ncbi:potassium channel, subfamily T, member 2 [Balamuthia mandrillaris]
MEEDTRLTWIILAVPVVLVVLASLAWWLFRRSPWHLPLLRRTSGFWLKEEAVRRALRHVMTDTAFATVWTLFQLAVTALALVHYAVTTYYGSLPLWLSITELLLSICFAADYLIYFYLASNRLRYFFSLLPLIDYLTVLPVFISFAAGDWNQNAFVSFAPLRTLRALRVVRALRATTLISSIVTRQILRIAVLMASLIFIGASLIQLVERLADGFEYDFHVLLYFTVVTFSTVGYGDISPVSDAGKMVMLVLIILAYVLLPYQLAHFVNVVALSKNYYLKTYSKRRIRPPPHAVFIGQAPNLVEIIQEFLTTETNPAASSMQVVILAPDKPSADLEIVLTRSKYRSRIFFLQGSTTSQQDLDRALLKSAEFCYIFSQAEHAEQDADHATLLTYLAVKERAKNIPTAVQLYQNRAVTPKHGFRILFQQSQLGYSTLITNLIRTYRGNSRGFSKIKNMNTWQGEYVRGAENDLFSLESLPQAFKGMTFAKVAKILYYYYHVILLGIECTTSETPQPSKQLNDLGLQQRTSALSRLGRALIQVLLSNFKQPAAKNIRRNGLLMMLPWDYVIKGGEMAAVVASSANLVEAISLFNTLMTKKDGYMARRRARKRKKKEQRAPEKTKEEKKTCSQLNHSLEDILTENEGDDEETMFERSEAEIRQQRQASLTMDEIDDKMRERFIQDLLDTIHVEKLASKRITKGRTALFTTKKVQQEINSPSFLSSLGLSNRVKHFSDPPLSLDDILQTRSSKGGIWVALTKRAIKPLSTGKKDVWGSLFHLNAENSGLPQTLPSPTKVIRSKHHLLLIGWRAGMESMILNLRSRNILYPRRIVILSERPPSLPLWQKLSLFPHIYYVKGSGLVEADLTRAAVSSADRIIILDRSSPSNSLGGKNEDESAPSVVLDDAENLFITRTILANWPHKALVSSIVDARNMRFMNEQTEDVLLKKLVKEYSKSQWGTSAYSYLESFAAGRLYTPSVINSLVVQLYWNPRILHMVKLLTGAGSTVVERICMNLSHFILQVRLPCGCNAWEIPVPDGMVGKTFYELFCYLLRLRVGVPVALYRKKQQPRRKSTYNKGFGIDDEFLFSESSSSDDSEFKDDLDSSFEMDELENEEWEQTDHYVYTNPEPHVQLRNDDKVFVMALSEPDFVFHQIREEKKKRAMKASWRKSRGSFEASSHCGLDSSGEEKNEEQDDTRKKDKTPIFKRRSKGNSPKEPKNGNAKPEKKKATRNIQTSTTNNSSEEGEEDIQNDSGEQLAQKREEEDDEEEEEEQEDVTKRKDELRP